MKNIRLFTLVLISSLLVKGVIAKETLLRLDLKKGQKYTMINSMDMTYFSDASLTTKVMAINFDITMVYTIVDKTDDGVHSIEATITAIKGTQNVSGMNLSYDSENPEAGGPMGAMLGEQLKPILNKVTAFKVNEFGEMVVKPKPEESSQMLSAEALLGQLFLELPRKEIKEKDTWTKTQSVNMVDGQDIKVNYTADEISKKEIKLSYSLDESSIDGGDQVQDLKVESKGNVVFDRKNGRVLSNILNQSAKGKNPQMGEFFMVSIMKLKAA